MDQFITKIMAGDLDAASLLLLFIVGILTKRFVPWWIYEEALEKLEQYESTAPALLDDIGELIDLMQSQQGKDKLSERQRDVASSLGPRIALEQQRVNRHPRRRKREVSDERP